MSSPYIGEIRMFAGNFAPAGWMLCQGQTLAIADNTPLFQLIGTTYGGDGQTTFNLPDLQSRLPIHMGTRSADGVTYTIGQAAGVETVTLTTQQVPGHSHSLGANTAAGASDPAGAIVAGGSVKVFSTQAPDQAMNAAQVQPNSGNQPHDNMQPFLAINFIISLFGVYPSQT